MMMSRRGSVTKLDKVFVESSAAYGDDTDGTIEEDDGLWLVISGIVYSVGY